MHPRALDRRPGRIARSLALVAGAWLATTVPAADASAHEVLHEVAPGRAMAVRVYESDGEAVAGALWEVYSPSAPGSAYQTGRTDRDGWLAFVPDAPGAWRVRVVEATGHGLDELVQVAAPGTAAAPAGAGSGREDDALFLLRPFIGLGLMAAIFGLLALWHRRSRGRP